jgi:nucleolar complex protein 2
MAPTKKQSKATRKFEKKHLKGVLEKRKAGAKIKQQQLIKARKQAKRAKDEDFYKGASDGDKTSAKANGKPGNKASDMSVDDFFKGGFEILDSSKEKGKLGKRKRNGPVAEEESSDIEEDVDLSDEEQQVFDDEAGESDPESLGDEEVGMSKAAMDALAKDDPEFYKFLQENDPEALDFDDNADLAEIDALSGDEDEEQPKKKQKRGDAAGAEDEEDSDEFLKDNELTMDMVSTWKKAMTETYSLRAARQIVLAFRCAAHLNDEDSENKQRYSISSPEVFHDVLVAALKQIPEVLQHHIPVKESGSGKVYISTETKKFKTLAILVKSFASSIIHLLGTLSDDATLKLTLSSLNPLLPYLLSFRKLLKPLIKTIVAFWSQSASSEATRLTAFLVLRRLVVIGDKGIRESALKAAYQGLIQGCRLTNLNTARGINLMKNSAAELWGIDQAIGYTTAFSFIRQLAIHLRNSIVQSKNDAHRKVYNWQYVHSLDFWSTVLAEHCSSIREAEAGKESQLKLLIYPLVQVTLGAMRLIPTALYFPLRFHLVRSLLRLTRATGTYIPLSSALLEVLNSAEMKKTPKSSTLKPLDFNISYKAPKSYLRTRTYQDGVGDQITELFSEYFALWATNIAFPEFSLPVVIMLKRWLKDARKPGSGNKNNKLVSSLVILVQKVEANGKFIEEKRAKVDFAPKDRAQVDAFLKDFDWEKTPIGGFVVVQRKVRAERQKMMEEARREEDQKRKDKEQELLNGDEEDEDDDEGDIDFDDDEEEAEE